MMMTQSTDVRGGGCGWGGVRDEEEVGGALLIFLVCNKMNIYAIHSPSSTNGCMQDIPCQLLWMAVLVHKQAEGLPPGMTRGCPAPSGQAPRGSWAW